MQCIVCDSSKKQLEKVGSWNTSKIVFDNGKAEYWLNDQKLLEFEAWTDDWFKRKEAGKWDFAPEYGLARSGHLLYRTMEAGYGSKI